MKKTARIKKKLQLSTETVRLLSSAHLAAAVGGNGDALEEDKPPDEDGNTTYLPPCVTT